MQAMQAIHQAFLTPFGHMNLQGAALLVLGRQPTGLIFTWSRTSQQCSPFEPLRLLMRHRLQPKAHGDVLAAHMARIGADFIFRRTGKTMDISKQEQGHKLSSSCCESMEFTMTCTIGNIQAESEVLRRQVQYFAREAANSLSRPHCSSTAATVSSRGSALEMGSRHTSEASQ